MNEEEWKKKVIKSELGIGHGRATFGTGRSNSLGVF